VPRPAIAIGLPPAEAGPVATELEEAGFEPIVVGRPDQLDAVLADRGHPVRSDPVPLAHEAGAILGQGGLEEQGHAAAVGLRDHTVQDESGLVLGRGPFRDE